MKIEAGKYYRTRDGRRVGPMNVPPQSGRWAPRIAADDGEDGWYADGRYTTSGKNPNDLIAEWSDPVDLTAITTPDYNDGKWHGWNGGECPVDPASVIDVHYINAFGGYGRDEGRLASQHSWALSCLFRVTKPAPPQPRTIYLCEVHDARMVFDTAIAATREALLYQHGEARVSEWEEKVK